MGQLHPDPQPCIQVEFKCGNQKITAHDRVRDQCQGKESCNFKPGPEFFGVNCSWGKKRRKRFIFNWIRPIRPAEKKGQHPETWIELNCVGGRGHDGSRQATTDGGHGRPVG